jgi:hypothetical protein
VDLGSVDALVASLGLTAIAGTSWGAFALEGGAGVRAGVASLAGRPDAGAVGHTFTGAWGGPLAHAGAAWAWAPAWAVVATAEGGWVTEETAGLVAGDPSVELNGAWWSSAVGLAWRP